MELELEGKVALVTGGSDGIGLATARRLGAAGARVAFCARRPDALAEAARSIAGGALAVVADVTRAEDCARFVAEAAERFGGVDILVNNAGRSFALPFEQVDDAGWDEDLDLKLRAWARCARAAIPHMRRAGGGRIVNVVSISGKHPGAGTTPTSISRAAGLALTKVLSKDLAADRILVNAVCVGVIKSGQTVRAWRESGSPLNHDAWCAEQGRDIPLGRWGEAVEVAEMIAFLVSARASYVTGAAINVDGGLSSAL